VAGEGETENVVMGVEARICRDLEIREQTSIDVGADLGAGVFVKEVDRLPGSVNGRASNDVAEFRGGAGGMPDVLGEGGFLEEQNVVAVGVLVKDVLNVNAALVDVL
jgi:hypothetical protein